MVWVRIDDHFDEHPKIAQLDDHALALFVCGLAYCNRNLTDGFIPSQVGLGQLRYCDGNTVPAIRQLERVGLWSGVDGGWQIHDYDCYQMSRDEVLADRARNAARQERFRRAKGTTALADNAVDNVGDTHVNNTVDNAASNGVTAPGSPTVSNDPPVTRYPVPVPGPVGTPLPPYPQNPESGADGPTARAARASPRATGTNPRALGTNPRAVDDGDGETTPPKWEEIVPGVHRGRPNGQGEVTLLRVRCPQCEKVLTPAEVDEHECIPVGQKIHPHAAPGNLGALLPKRKPRTDDQKAAEAELARLEREKADRGPVELPPDLAKYDAELRAKAARNGAKEEP